MDSIEYAHKLSKEFGTDQSDTLKMLDDETDAQRSDLFRSCELTYQQGLDAAYEAIREWLTNGDEYVVKQNWESLAQFAGSHRRACVWAVFTCKARKARDGSLTCEPQP